MPAKDRRLRDQGGNLLAEVAEGHVEGKVLGSFEIWPSAFRA